MWDTDTVIKGFGGKSGSKAAITDSQRIDFLEKKHPEIWSDLSVNQRYSVDGGESWQNDLRSAIDAAMLEKAGLDE